MCIRDSSYAESNKFRRGPGLLAAIQEVQSIADGLGKHAAGLRAFAGAWQALGQCTKRVQEARLQAGSLCKQASAWTGP
eukprot:7123622-Alexandrium_andersonii.AAC.1